MTRNIEFHKTAAHTLFLCKRAMPDLQATVPLLCTRVGSPDDDDWKEPLSILKCLENSVEEEPLLSPTGWAVRPPPTTPKLTSSRQKFLKLSISFSRGVSKKCVKKSVCFCCAKCCTQTHFKCVQCTLVFN